MMYSQWLFIISILLAGSTAKLLFSGRQPFEGAIIPHIKKKHGRIDVTEDTFIRSPYAILVADGLGGADFNSYFISSSTTLGVMDSFVKDYSNGLTSSTANNFRQKIAAYIDSELQSYRNICLKFGKELCEDPNNRLFNKLQAAPNSATTFVGLFLENNAKITNLHVVQRGDSLAGVWRLTEIRGRQFSGVKYVYLPVYKSTEQQRIFNGPFCISENENFYTESLSDEIFEVYEGDIVLAGSDGLWDNVPLTVLTWAINYFVNQLGNGFDVIGAEEKLKTLVNYYLKDPDQIKWGKPHEQPRTLPVNPSLKIKKTDYQTFLMSCIDSGVFMSDYEHYFGKYNWKRSINGVLETSQQALKHIMDIPLAVNSAQSPVYAPPFTKVSFKVSKELPSNYDPNFLRAVADDGSSSQGGKQDRRLTQKNPYNPSQNIGTQGYQPMVRYNYNYGQFGNGQSGVNTQVYRPEINQINYQAIQNPQPYVKVGNGQNYGGMVYQVPVVNAPVGYNNNGYGLGNVNRVQTGQNRYSPQGLGYQNYGAVDNQKLQKFLEFKANQRTVWQGSQEALFALRAFESCSDDELYGGDEPAGLVVGLIPDCFASTMSTGFNLDARTISQFWKNFNSKKMSTILAKTAFEFSHNTEYLSQFSANSKRWKVQDNFIGGKPDDITVVMDILKESVDMTAEEIANFKATMKDEKTIRDSNLKSNILSFLRAYRA